MTRRPRPADLFGRRKPVLSRRRETAIAAALVLGLAGAGAAAAFVPWGTLFDGAPMRAPKTPADPAAHGAEARSLAAVPVFVRPQLEALLSDVTAAYRGGDVQTGENLLRGILGHWPHLRELRVALARSLASRGQPDRALEALREAVADGYREAGRVQQDPVFATMRALPAYPDLLAALQEPAPEETPPAPAIPSPLTEGKAVIGPANTEWSRDDQVPRAYFSLPAPAASPQLATTGDDAASRLLNRLVASGEAAGNRGDFYENRDDGHSRLKPGLFPELTPLEHGPDAVAAGYARGLAQGLAVSADGQLYPPLFGNSSTAVLGSLIWRSMARRALTEARGPLELWREYASNQLYIYPEHKDHDPFYGDVFPAMTPYDIVTQGSSWSDKEAMRCVAMILAALKPETKRMLVRERLVAPMVQAIWRRGQKGIESEADYLSPIAHPTVFDPVNADAEKMVRLANALTPAEVPPMVQLQVLQETQPARGVTLFADGFDNRLFDTPSAIARTFRTTERTLRMTVAAGATRPLDDRPLRFAWVVLRGDPARVRVTPLGQHGEAADIQVDWQSQVAAPPRGLRSHRVDIAVFAQVEGAWTSAPAFISVAFPPRQERIYDDQGRLAMINYDAMVLQAEYADPAVWPERGWRDIYDHDAQGRPLGWTRQAQDAFEVYTRHGARVIERDDKGRALRAEVMSYPLGPGSAARRVRRVATGETLVYEYDGPDDRQGVARPERSQ